MNQRKKRSHKKFTEVSASYALLVISSNLASPSLPTSMKAVQKNLSSLLVITPVPERIAKNGPLQELWKCNGAEVVVPDRLMISNSTFGQYWSHMGKSSIRLAFPTIVPQTSIHSSMVMQVFFSGCPLSISKWNCLRRTNWDAAEVQCVIRVFFLSTQNTLRNQTLRNQYPR